MTLKKLELKHRIYNSSMNNGNKKTVEKFLLKTLKKIQKTSNKRHSSMLMLAIKNSTPALKMNKQKMKRNKKKYNKDIPTFVQNSFLRINLSLKYIILSSIKNSEYNKFYTKLSNEIVESSAFKSQSTEQKTNLQKQILLQKNLFFKYRWKKKK